MTGSDLCVYLATSVPVIFEPPCICGVSVWRPKGKRGYLVELGVNGDNI